MRGLQEKSIDDVSAGGFLRGADVQRCAERLAFQATGAVEDYRGAEAKPSEDRARAPRHAIACIMSRPSTAHRGPHHRGPSRPVCCPGHQLQAGRTGVPQRLGQRKNFFLWLMSLRVAGSVMRALVLSASSTGGCCRRADAAQIGNLEGIICAAIQAPPAQESRACRLHSHRRCAPGPAAHPTCTFGCARERTREAHVSTLAFLAGFFSLCLPDGLASAAAGAPFSCGRAARSCFLFLPPPALPGPFS